MSFLKIGKESTESAFKLYKGVAALNIVAVNPTKEELSTLLNRTIDKDQEYLAQTDDGKTQVRITFYGKTNPDSKTNNGIELIVPITFTLVADHRVGQTSGKVQVVDKYGRFGWATEEEISTGAIPAYKNGPANISAGYRKACQGEEALTEFLLTWLNVPNPAEYKNGSWIMKADPSDSEIELPLKELFKGDVSSLKGIITAASNHLVKAAVGVRTTDEGKQYQAVFTRKFVKNAVTDYSKLDAAITDFQNNGGAANTVFSTKDLHENVVESTSYSETEDSGDTPWG